MDGLGFFNNLDLIGHSAFVIAIYFYHGSPGRDRVGRGWHKCRGFYQIEIIVDPEPSINFRYECENRMRSMQIFVAGWKS